MGPLGWGGGEGGGLDGRRLCIGEGGDGVMTGQALGFLCIKTGHHNNLFSGSLEGRGTKPRTELLVCRVQGAFAFNPKLAVPVDISSAATPVVEVGEPFVFKRHPMFLTIIKVNEPSPTKRTRGIDPYSYTNKTTTVTFGSVVRVMNGPHRFANLFCYFSVSEM